jgi:protein TonB
MRKFTLLISVVVHITAAVAIFIAPLLAVEKLPVVRSQTLFASVLQAQVLPQVPRSGSRHVRPSPHASVPLDAPDGLHPEVEVAPSDEVDLGFDRGVGDGVPDVPGGSDIGIEPPPPPPPPPLAPKPPVRVGVGVERPRKIVDVAPVYPPLAVVAKIQGDVILEAVLAEDGTVRDVRVLRSTPLLDQAAVEAVRQWRFTPTKLNGVPVPLILSVTVTFRLR